MSSRKKHFYMKTHLNTVNSQVTEVDKWLDLQWFLYFCELRTWAWSTQKIMKLYRNPRLFISWPLRVRPREWQNIASCIPWILSKYVASRKDRYLKPCKRSSNDTQLLCGAIFSMALKGDPYFPSWFFLHRLEKEWNFR